MTAPILSSNLVGNPYVEVFFPEYLAGTVRVNVERQSDGRVWPVRGGVNVAAGVAVLDFEVPFYVPSSYRAECFDASGLSLGFTDSSTVTIYCDQTWVHQPLAPQLAITIAERLGTAEELMRPSDGEAVWVEGATTARWIGSGRRGLVDVPYSFLTFTLEDADMIQRMLGGYGDERFPPVLCIRTPPPVRVPRTFFTSVAELSEVDEDVKYGGSRVIFNFRGTEVDPPFPGLTTPLLTYADLDAAFGSYAQRDAYFSSYSEMDRAYEFAGTA